MEENHSMIPPASSDGELSDEELSAVSGGASSGTSNPLNVLHDLLAQEQAQRNQGITPAEADNLRWLSMGK